MFNDNDENMNATAKFCKEELGDEAVEFVQLLPYHQMGERRYEFLNRPYELTGVKALHPEDLEDYRKIFLDHGIDCFF